MVHQILPALPARIAVIKTKPEPFPQVDVAQSTSESSLVPISKAFSSTIVSKPSNLRKVDGIRSEDKDQPAAESSNQSAVPKLSEAALARRRKREQGRQTDVTTVPMF